MSELLNPFAIDEKGNVVYIKNGNESDKERYRNCFCPICKEKLIAKMGTKNIWHFSHKSDSTCKGSFETGLHLYGKEALRKGTEILFPNIVLYDVLGMTMYDNKKKYEIKKWLSMQDIDTQLEFQGLKLFKENIYNYKYLNTETYIDNFKPDVLIEVNGKKTAIEICATHSVDEKKTNKVIKNDIDMLEIYLEPKEIMKKLKETNFSIDKYILEEADRKWINKTGGEHFNNIIEKLIHNYGRFIPNEKYTNKKNIEMIKKLLTCPACGGQLKLKHSGNREFYGCENYPQCDYAKPDLWTIICPQCKRKLRKIEGKYGTFIGHDYSFNYNNKCNYHRKIYWWEEKALDRWTDISFEKIQDEILK